MIGKMALKLELFLLPVVRVGDVMHLSEVAHILTGAADLVDALAGVRHAGVVPGAPGAGPLRGVGDEGSPAPRLVTSPSPSPGLTNLRPRPHACVGSRVKTEAYDSQSKPNIRQSKHLFIDH